MTFAACFPLLALSLEKASGSLAKMGSSGREALRRLGPGTQALRSIERCDEIYFTRPYDLCDLTFIFSFYLF